MANICSESSKIIFPLGELTTLPRPQVGWGRETPSPFPRRLRRLDSRRWRHLELDALGVSQSAPNHTPIEPPPLIVWLRGLNTEVCESEVYTELMSTAADTDSILARRQLGVISTSTCRLSEAQVVV